jgi:chromosomal replication initiator protein
VEGAATSATPTNGRDGSSQQVRLEPTRVGGEGGTSYINPRYTFANFIVGSANRLAHAASLSVAERPGPRVQPAVPVRRGGPRQDAPDARDRQPGHRQVPAQTRRVRHEREVHERVHRRRSSKARSTNSAPATAGSTSCSSTTSSSSPTRNGRRGVLPHVQCHPRGRQADRPLVRPTAEGILTLEERLRSRFEWGLIADLTGPDLETRIAILRSKAEEGAVPITSDVIEFIARKVVSNIRELEGALNRIVAYASMGAMPISIELARPCLSNVLYNPKKRQVTPERIARVVSEYYSVPMDALQGQKRDKAIVVPRQIAMFLMREETDVSLLRIGAELGGRDHSTVLHACDKINREVAVNDELRREIAAVRELIYARLTKPQADGRPERRLSLPCAWCGMPERVPRPRSEVAIQVLLWITARIRWKTTLRCGHPRAKTGRRRRLDRCSGTSMRRSAGEPRSPSTIRPPATTGQAARRPPSPSRHPPARRVARSVGFHRIHTITTVTTG